MKKTERIQAIDILRGLTVAGMILVNQPGSWKYKYAQLKHAAWDGCTLTDLIFPFFLFIIGASMWFSFQKTKELPYPDRFIKILRRSVVIFLLGLTLNIASQYMSLGEVVWAKLRITGVLQRIAICYLIGAVLCVFFQPKTLMWISGGILLAYWGLSWGFGGADPFTPESGIVGKIDRALLGANHLRSGYPVDSSSFFASIPATVHLLWGYLCGRLIAQTPDRIVLVKKIGLIGLVAMTVALLWNLILPFNKSLWSSSYVLYTNGIALVFLGLMIWLVDVKKKKKWASPFLDFGLNPLAIYFLSEFMGGLLSKVIKVSVNGEMMSFRNWAFGEVLSPVLGGYNASLVYALLVVLFWWGVAYLMNKNRIYIKI